MLRPESNRNIALTCFTGYAAAVPFGRNLRTPEASGTLAYSHCFYIRLCKLFLKKIFLILFILFSISVNCQENEECVFDRTTQTDKFIIEKGNFTDYEWNNENKTATIKLENGEILKVFRGGCVHFGMSAELFTDFDSSKIKDFDFWLDRALWITKNVFENKDHEHLKKHLAQKEYHLERDDNSLYIFVPHETYDEFSISLRIEEGKAVLYVGYYFS